MRFYTLSWDGSHIYEKLNFVGIEVDCRQYSSYRELVSRTNDGKGLHGSSVDW